MTPAEIYALPSTSSIQWYASDPDLWEKLFGLTPNVYSADDIDGDPADANGRLMVETKLECMLDWGERTASVTAVTFDGSPFAIIAAAGRGQSDFGDVLLTDHVAFDEAFSYFVSKAMTTRASKPLLVDASMEVPLLEGFYGTSIIKTGEGVEMVREEYVDDAGKLIFDVKKYRAAFQEGRKYLSGFSLDQALLANNPDVRRIAADIIEKGVVDDFRHVAINRRSKKQSGEGDWIAVAAANETGTYAIGVRNRNFKSTGFSWASDVYCERIGGTGLFDELKATVTASISDGMKP
jgi:hypothetical protein